MTPGLVAIHFTLNRINGDVMRNRTFSLKASLFLFVVGIVAGCVHQPMNAVIASWQGQPVAEVVAAWGTPSEELLLEGKRLLLWNTFAGKLAPAGTKSLAPPPGQKYCVRLLKVDGKGRIVEGTWDGNDCPEWFSGWAR